MVLLVGLEKASQKLIPAILTETQVVTRRQLILLLGAISSIESAAEELKSAFVTVQLNVVLDFSQCSYKSYHFTVSLDLFD